MRNTHAGAGFTPLHDAVLVGWIALIGADRVDLLGGGGAFQLTPFLVLTPVVLLSELIRRRRAGRPIEVPTGVAIYHLLALALVAVCGVSVFLSLEITKSASRLALLSIDILGAALVLLAASDRADVDRVLERGAVNGLLLFVAFNALQLGSLAGLVPDVWRVGSATVDLFPHTYGGIVPRLSGMVADQNRSGLVLLFFGWFAGYRPGRRPRASLLLLAFALSVLTLSRSAAVAGLVTFIVLVLERRIRRVSARTLLRSSSVAGAAILWLLVSPAARDWIETALEPLALRVSLDEGSSQEHLMLIARGVREATVSLPRLAVGLGYGSAYTVLQDVFPGNRYGNFHSLYITMLAESGMFALLLTLLLFAVPLFRGGRYRALIAGAAVFNLFYQAQTEPAFWLMMALAWFTLPAPTPSSRSPARIMAGAA